MITAEVLREYASSALQNAVSLQAEARLLLEHRYNCRAYFLAVASIEEVGKAVLAFDGLGRNLKDPAVETRLLRSFGDHSAKIRTAFAPWLQASSDPREAIQVAIDLIIALTHGREPSMYTDIALDTGRVQRPQDAVRDVAANDAVRLAGDCLVQARLHIESVVPTQKNRDEDQLFTMRSADLMALVNTEDFWWYYISRVESGDNSWAPAIVTYRQDFILKGKAFRN